MERNKIFLDTSILITALLSFRGDSFYILNNLKDKFRFQINKFVLEETLKVLDEKFYQRKELKDRLFILIGLAKIEILSNPSKVLLKKLSPKIINKEDAPILAGALERSNFLLTLDKDFLNEKVKKFVESRNLLICTPKEFLVKFKNNL